MAVDTHIVLDHDDFKSEETFDDLLRDLGVSGKFEDITSITLRVISVETSTF